MNKFGKNSVDCLTEPNPLEEVLKLDLENWMRDLPDDVKRLPITQIAIPGTHDSMSFSIRHSSAIAPDFEYPTTKCFGNVISCFVARWAKTQDYNSVEQLKCGIRYFDLRVSTRDGTNEFYFVHGLYAGEVWDVLSQIKVFLDDHPSEVVFIDFNHFYAFTQDDHQRLVSMIKEIFESKLIPSCVSIDKLSLANLTMEAKNQVFCIYRSRELPGQESGLLWPSAYFPTPWPNTIDKKHLVDVLTRNLQKRNPKICYISQFVLTPDSKFVAKNLFSSLKKSCAVSLVDVQKDWLSKQKAGLGGINIVITDFMNLSLCHFSNQIIALNMKI